MDDHDGTVSVLAVSPFSVLKVGLGSHTSASEICLYHVLKECWLVGH